MITLEATQTLRGKASVASKVTVSVFGMELTGSEAYKVLYQGQLGTGVSTLYTVGGGIQAFIRSIHVVNNDTSIRSFKLYVGGSADANAIIPDISIPIGGLAVYDSDAWRVYDSSGGIQETVNTGSAVPHHVSHEVGGSDEVAITHAETTGQTTDDHHDESHAHDGVDSSGTVAHADTTGKTANDHHNQAHSISGADHSGSLPHSSLSGIGATDHHTNANDPSAGEKAALAGTDGTPGSGDKYVTDSDARNTNARTPTGHHASHDAGGGDAMVIDAAAATGSLRTLGTGAAQAVAGNDSRLSDARTPTAHHVSHEVGGGDAVGITHAQTTGQTANDHHAQAHVFSGADHTASGLTVGNVVRATGASTFAWAQLQHGDLGGVGADDHHNHLTIGADGEHSLATQVLSGVDATTSQKGHLALDATTGTDTTPGTAGIAGAGGKAADGLHTHRSPGGLVVLTADVAIANTETQVLGFSCPANTLIVGTTFRIKAFGIGTSGGTGGSGVFRIRIATTSLGGTIITAVTAINSNSQTGQGFEYEGLLTIRSTGAGGTAAAHSRAQGRIMFTVVEIQSAENSSFGVDTTATKIIELTYISGNAGTTLTFRNASIERIML